MPGVTTLPPVVDSTLNYYLEVADGGQTEQYPGTAGDKRRKWNPKQVRINDVRGREDDFSLHKNGFQWTRLQSQVLLDVDGPTMEKVGYPEVAQLLKDVYVETHHSGKDAC
jgi:hypothetical protein